MFNKHLLLAKLKSISVLEISGTNVFELLGANRVRFEEEKFLPYLIQRKIYFLLENQEQKKRVWVIKTSMSGEGLT